MSSFKCPIIIDSDSDDNNDTDNTILVDNVTYKKRVRFRINKNDYIVTSNECYTELDYAEARKSNWRELMINYFRFRTRIDSFEDQYLRIIQHRHNVLSRMTSLYT